MSKYSVGGKLWATKEAIRKHASEILKRYEMGQRLDTEDEAFMLDLLEQHPTAAEKIGSGVRGVRIGTGPYGDKAFYLLRSDGRAVNFSYRKCISPPTYRSLVLKAARTEVFAQTQAVKEAAFEHEPVHCPVLGRELTWETAHVDHMAPDTFQALWARFVAVEDVDIERLVVDQHRDMRHYFADRSFAERWQSYHAAHARLRVISAEANVANGRGR